MATTSESGYEASHLRWLLERQLHWIAAADTKAAGLLATYMAMTAIAATVLSESGSAPARGALLFAFSGVLAGPGVGFALSVFFPRTKANHASLIYFGEIAKLQASAEFVERLQSSDDEVVRLDLANQVHVNAVIAACKHRHVRVSMVFGGISLVLWLVALAVIGGAS